MRYIFFVFFVFLAGCVTSYSPSGLTGGYSEIQLNEDEYKVTFRGNGFTSKNAVTENLLRRCAELTVNHGYKYFLIIGSNIDAKTSYFATPTTVDTDLSGSVSGSGFGSARSIGNNVNYDMSYSGSYAGSAHTTVTPGHTYTTNKYQAIAIIKMSNTKSEYSINAAIYLSNYLKR